MVLVQLEKIAAFFLNMYNVGISLKMLCKKIDLLWCPPLKRVNSAIEIVFSVHSPPSSTRNSARALALRDDWVLHLYPCTVFLS